MIENWRTYAIIVIVSLWIIDLVATYYYVKKYKKWQPNKPYELIELNPLLRFLWNEFGLELGTMMGASVILFLVYVVVKIVHWSIVVLLFSFLCFALYNHYLHISLLKRLIKKYPKGYIPVDEVKKEEEKNK